MTEENRTGPELTAPALVQPAEEGLPCWFGRLREAGSSATELRCEEPAAVRVYAIPLCEAHGAESEAGMRVSMYQDAHDRFECLDAPHVGRDENRAAAWAREKAANGLFARLREAEEDGEEALRLAYPLREDLMDEDARDFDYEGAGKAGLEVPEEWYWSERLLIHKFTRLAHERGVHYLVELLETTRQDVSMQLAYAIQHGEHSKPAAR